jgi:flagellar hook-basal body complex protein FliE
MSVPTLTVRPSGVSPADAARAYGQVDSGAVSGASAGNDFAGMLQRAVEGAVDAGHDADVQAMQAIAGNGNLTDVVTAVSRAELALQTTVAIRDRVVQAYQEIMRIPI